MSRFTDKTGQNVPAVTFPTRQNNEWVNVTTNELFKDKTVIVFSLPGAFTPTCSSAHLPRFNELAATFAENGVDDIICMSVNDTFVMNAWSVDQEASNITVIPDGNGEFTDGMGMLVDNPDLGFGKRSWRYSMLVKNGVIDKMFIEADVDGDPFAVSDAETMLNYINSNAELPKVATIFTKNGCSFCAKAKEKLQNAGISYEEINISNSNITSRTLRAVAKADTVPQIFIDGEYIGGSEDLETYLGK